MIFFIAIHKELRYVNEFFLYSRLCVQLNYPNVDSCQKMLYVALMRRDGANYLRTPKQTRVARLKALGPMSTVLCG